MDSERTISADEVAELLKVAEDDVWEMVHFGMPAHHLVNEHIRFFADEVLEWVRGRPRPDFPPLPRSLAGSTIPIGALDLSVRSYTRLCRHGIQTLGDLIELSESDLRALPDLESKDVENLEERLAVFGIKLSVDD